jgi:hypothetical protein
MISLQTRRYRIRAVDSCSKGGVAAAHRQEGVAVALFGVGVQALRQCPWLRSWVGLANAQAALGAAL